METGGTPQITTWRSTRAIIKDSESLKKLSAGARIWV